MFTYKSSHLAFSHRARFKGLLQQFFKLSVVYFFLLLCTRAFELIYNNMEHGQPAHFLSLVLFSVYQDLLFFLRIEFWLFLLFSAIYYFSVRAATITYGVLSAILLLIQLGLIFYFQSALVPLGADLYGYSMAEIKQTVGAAGSLNMTSLFGFLILISLCFFLFRFASSIPDIPKIPVRALPVIILIPLLLPSKWLRFSPNFQTDFVNNLVLNKTNYFINSSQDYFYPPDNDIDIYADNFIGLSDDGNSGKGIEGFRYLSPAQYPFLHNDGTADVLSPYFNIDSAVQPNIVIVLVEGLGRAFTNEGAYLGNFTPFIDSLSKKSLYWSNFLSEGGRTFAVLPSILGSLPFGRHGFCELGNAMPPQLSLMSLLKYNGYSSGFFYGGNARFDNMNIFLQHQGVDAINDESSFGAGYEKMPSSANGFSWGYGDKELFRHYFSLLSQQKQPYLNVLLTVSTHNPFLINDENIYLQKFEQRLTALGLSPEERKQREDYKLQFASILFMDDAVKAFFDMYARRPDFKNTIFLITGDHRMPEIPMATKLDRYHVPLIIYSPMLKRTAKFQSISTHFDIAPSLLAFLRHHYSVQAPNVTSWMGTGLDTSRNFRNVHAYPFIQTKDGTSDFIMGSWMLHGRQELYQITPEMGLVPTSDAKAQAEVSNALNNFTNRNNSFIQGAPLIPDSVYQKYKPGQRK